MDDLLGPTVHFFFLTTLELEEEAGWHAYLYVCTVVQVEKEGFRILSVSLALTLAVMVIFFVGGLHTSSSLSFWLSCRKRKREGMRMLARSGVIKKYHHRKKPF